MVFGNPLSITYLTVSQQNKKHFRTITISHTHSQTNCHTLKTSQREKDERDVKSRRNFFEMIVQYRRCLLLCVDLRILGSHSHDERSRGHRRHWVGWKLLKHASCFMETYTSFIYAMPSSVTVSHKDLSRATRRRRYMLKQRTQLSDGHQQVKALLWIDFHQILSLQLFGFILYLSYGECVYF